MAGSDREVKEYEYLAQYYDYLLGDEDAFEYWLKYIEEKPFNSCLELASGSGVMAKLLKQRGKEVVASDISAEMKRAALKNFDGEYLILNMVDFNLDRQFDLILCICDSINYLNYEEIEKMFKNVYCHLNNGGRFIFDIHNPLRLKEFADEYIEEGQIDDDTYYQWTINSDLEEKTINEHFTFYTKEGMIQELHCQNVFEISAVSGALQKAGFDFRCIEDFILDEKCLFIGTKQ